MIYVSNEFKEQMAKGNRAFSASCTITLKDKTVIYIDDSKLWSDGFVIDRATSNSGSFDIGAAIIGKFTMRLNNMYDEYTEIDFSDAEVSDVKVSLALPSGKKESVQFGIYTVNDTKYDGDLIALECLDNMRKFDIAWTVSKLTYPATLQQIVQDACNCCGVTLATDSLQFAYSDYVILQKPEDTSVTFRDVLTWVGQICGLYWKCNPKGQLLAGWYSMSDLAAVSNIHNLQNDVITDLSVDMEDVVITGVKIIVEGDSSENLTYQSGQEGYMLGVEENRFITSSNGAEIADMLGSRVVGLRFRPMTLNMLQDPTIEAGDGAIVYDRKMKQYKTFFTDVQFSLDDDLYAVNEAESAIRNSAERFSADTRAYQRLKRQMAKRESEVDKAFDDLKKAMDETQGLFPVSVKQEDGSSILYLCDKPTLGESQVVIKLNREGWGMSTDGGETWNVGALVDGTTITKILDAVGINANWLKTGRIEIMDDDGNVIFEADIDKKSVSMNPDSVHIGDKTISEVLSDNKNMTMLLSDDYQGIPVDSSGNYKNFPSGITTTATVMYGSNDISKDCTYTVTTSSGVTGSWDKNSRTYTVTGLTTDKGWVTIRATYLSSVSVAKKFNLSKNYAGKDGADGDPGEMYYLKSSNTVIKRGADGLLYPDSITFSGYRSGTGGRPPYAGRFVIEETTDGNTWKTVYTSSTDEAEVTHLLYSAIAALNGKLLTTRSGKFLAVPRDFVELRVSLYAAGGTTQLIDRLSIPLVVDMAALTHEDIFNLLTDDGRIKGIYKEGNQLYINATYIRSLHVTGDQVDAKKLKVVNKDGSVTLYIDEDGNVEMKVSSFSIQGKTVDDIASTVAASIAEKKASNAVKGQTQEDIFNKLSKNGTIKSVTMVNGELYISFDFAQGGTLKLGGANNGNGLLSILDASGNEIGYINNTGVHFNQGEFSGTVTAGTGAIAGWKIISDYLESDDGSIRLYKDGRIVFGGDAVLSANGRTPMVKYGLSIYTQRRTTKADDGTEFYDGSGELNIYGLGSTSSANTLALNMNNYSVGYVASSSMRYKTIGKTVQEEELEELYRIKVIWAKYKDDYLSEHDERYGKEMPMFLAEDIDRRFPLAVDHNEKGKAENWNYRIMIPCMFAMLKNDHEKVLALQSDNQILLSKIDALSTEVERLKELINNISRKE